MKLKVDVLVAGPTEVVKAAQTATKTIPIVMAFVSDPVASRFVANVARPGGNITGFSLYSRPRQAASVYSFSAKWRRQSRGSPSSVTLVTPGPHPTLERRKLPPGRWACRFRL